MLPNELVDYKELKPRGHYTKSETLKRYFKTFKWISLNGVDVQDDNSFKGLLGLAFIIKSDPALYSLYNKYTSAVEKLAGQEDNVSIKDVIAALKETKNEATILSEESMERVRNEIAGLNKKRVKRVLGKNFITKERKVKRVYFLSSTYSVSGEIFSKLIHVDGVKSKRPFPKGLDIPAVFGNNTAKEIIVNEYGDGKQWPKYEEKLTELQTQFNGFKGWDHNYGVRALKTALAASSEQDVYPDFMKTSAYNRKELNTTLASWTHIKHDLILYQEKPYAAETGQGGGPEPPKHYSYVEPNLEFWEEAKKLVTWLENLAKLNNAYQYQLNEIREIGTLLGKVAWKQLNDKEITEKEYQEMHWIGGNIEYILLGLLETDHLPEREKSMALIADVYAYLSPNGLKQLNVAVGHADDIYVVVPIKGEYYIARGSTFSYYEFQDNKIYNDDEWRSKVRSKDIPDRPEWIQSQILNIEPLKGQMEYRY